MLGCAKRNAKLCSSLFLVVGTIIVIVAAVVKYRVFPSKIDDEVKKNLELKEGTEGWDAFIESPVPVYVHYTFLNVSNIDDVLKNGSIPKLVEIGPYVYKKSSIRKDISFIEPDSVVYNNWNAHYFDEDESNKRGCFSGVEGEPCKDTYKVTIINPFFSILTHLLATSKDIDVPENILPMGIDLLMSLNTLQIFSTDSVKNFLYDGTKVPLLEIALKVIHLYKPELLDDLPGQITSDGRFAFFGGENETITYSQRQNTGADNWSKYMEVIGYNGKASLPESWWPNCPSRPTDANDGACHDLKGTAGTQFAPGVDKEMEIWIFSTDLCRSIYLKFEKEADVRGIPTYRYRPTKELLSNENENNYCYVPGINDCKKLNGDQWNISDCKTEDYMFWTGILNVQGCKNGLPIYMSLPHFLNGEDWLSEKLDGLSPNPEEHDVVLDVEPITGTVLRAHKRIMISVPVKAIDKVLSMKQVSSLWKDRSLFPMFWVDETGELDEENGDKLYDSIVKPINIVNGCTIFALVVGAIFMLSGLSQSIICMKNKE